MTLRHRVSVAAAVGVLIVVAAVSSMLYFFYAASVHSRADVTLIDAAQQASSITQRIKQSASGGASTGEASAEASIPSSERSVRIAGGENTPIRFRSGISSGGTPG